MSKNKRGKVDESGSGTKRPGLLDLEDKPKPSSGGKVDDSGSTNKPSPLLET
jgi:hypothetical protein